MVDFERKLANDELDAADIVRGILKVQASFAAAQNRPLGRGTHTKGVCARATFEVFDLSHKVHDHTLAARLAHGIYAKPGIYPATVRFANAASTIYPDRDPDLRAMSFSVELPPELAGASQFQDYSLQSNPVFPINDSHTFAVLMSVLSAGSNRNQLKAILSLSLPDQVRFLKAAILGKLQLHGKYLPYQKIRYWSTVPFRNGPFEAVMYSAMPSPHNHAHEPQNEPDALRDELIRHLDEDEKMSSFDIALQLLDTGKMTHWGMHREASFWVENATVEWKESQAPFHVVGRLTLLPKSAMEVSACEPRFIDVTDHATPDSQPLGSINRARRAAELASRKVRLGQATAEELLESLPTAPPVHRSLPVTALKLLAVGFVGLIVAYCVAGLAYTLLAKRAIPAQDHIDQVRYLNQGWGADREAPERELYYYTAQGSGMHGVRYSWFVNLERPFSRTRLTDPDHMRALDFVVEPAPSPGNRDQLPVGFAKRWDDQLHEPVVDITCAACHTGQLNMKSATDGSITAVRIDGGESMAAFTDTNIGSFQVDLALGFLETLGNPMKFNRFSEAVLGPKADTLSAKLKLWQDVAGVTGGLGKLFISGSSMKKLYPVQEGYGRTDALARIGNVVFGDHISPHNFYKGDAPVSYPYLWNIWKFNWVQYNASVSQPMARNVSEAMGVGADFAFMDAYGRPLPPEQRFTSSVQFDNLIKIETTLQKLTPPQWPRDIVPIDEDKAKKGKVLFDTICAKCHGPHEAMKALKVYASPGRGPNDPLWDIRGVTIDKIGTDPTEAINFNSSTVDLTKTGLTFDEIQPMLKKQQEIQKARYEVLMPALEKELAEATKAGADQDTLEEYQTQLQEMKDQATTEQTIAQTLGSIDMKRVNVGTALNILGMKIRDLYFKQHSFSPEAEACFAGFDMLDIPAVVEQYKPRPLEGVWATPPFLHNGSVANLWDLLGPVNKRTPKFFVGRRTFDPVKVGYVTEPLEGTRGGFWLDTSIPGNENTGHEFSGPPNAPRPWPRGVIGRAFTEEERWEIIEYLKIHQDPPTPERTPADCFKLLNQASIK